MTHTPPRPSCWTDIASPILWLSEDIAKHERALFTGEQPDYRCAVTDCAAYPSLSGKVRVACAGCAKIGGEG